MVTQRIGDGVRPVHTGRLNGPGSSRPKTMKICR